MLKENYITIENRAHVLYLESLDFGGGYLGVYSYSLLGGGINIIGQSFSTTAVEVKSFRPSGWSTDPSRFYLRISPHVPGTTCTLSRGSAVTVAETGVEIPIILAPITATEEIRIDCMRPMREITMWTPEGELNRSPVLFKKVTLSSDPKPKVSISIDSMRVAQRVFEPSATDGSSVDLVTKKTFAVEVTLSGSIPAEHKELMARADLYVNGTLRGSSSDFRIGSIINGHSKAFIFGREDSDGNKVLRVHIVPVTPVPDVFDASSVATASRDVNFHDIKLSLLISEITGCRPFVTDCFSAPTSQQRNFLETQQVPFLEEQLPISGGGVQLTSGINWTLSNPDRLSQGSSIFADAGFVWMQKKLAFKDIGVALVSDEFFIKHGFTIPSGNTIVGLFISTHPGVVYVTANSSTTLAHEATHSLSGLTDSKQSFVDGVGSGPNEIWTSGLSLDPGIVLGPLAENIFYETVPSLYMNELNLGRPEYNASFKSLTAGKIDPQVILVAGTIDANNQSGYLEIKRGEAFLDGVVSDPDLTIQGLDRLGTVVSSVPSRSANRLELIKSNGPNEQVVTTSSFFTATLPDNGTIENVRVLRGMTSLFTVPVDQITLRAAIDGLNIESFKLKSLAAKIALKLVEVEFSQYLSWKSKNNPKLEYLSLMNLRVTLAVILKDTIRLDSGKPISKSDILRMMDAELALLKRKLGNAK